MLGELCKHGEVSGLGKGTSCGGGGDGGEWKSSHVLQRDCSLRMMSIGAR